MKKRFLSLIIALAMMVGVFTPLIASAAEENAQQTTKVLIHKILMEDKELNKKDANNESVWPKKHDGKEIKNIQEFFGTNAKPINGVAFRIYEVKDAAEEGFTKGDQLTKTDKLATGDLDANKYYKLVKFDSTNKINNDPKQNTQEYILSKIVGTEKGIAEVTLPNGTYRVVEDKTNSTYKGEKGETLTGAKAVPFDLTLPAGLPDGTGNYDNADNPLHVYPKNTEKAPKIDKNFKYGKDEANVVEKADKGAEPEVGANYDNYGKKKSTVTSELGKKIPYEVKTQIPANAKYNKLVWDDQMQKGLVYNKDLTITGIDGLEKGKDYVLYETNRGFRLVFKDSGLTKVQEAAEKDEVELTLTYSAHLDGTVKPDEVKENNVTFDYSNKPGNENDTPDVKPSNKQITVEKTWAADGKEITEADRHVKALFTLQVKNGDNWVDVETYESNYKENFTHTFQGLDDNKTYRVVESVSGYEPEYQKTTEDGKVVIVNKIDNDNPKTLKPTNPKVVNGGKKFVKTNQDGSERLAGAEFLVKNNKDEYLVKKVATDDQKNAVTTAKQKLDEAVQAYNNLTAEQQAGEEGKNAKTAIDSAQEAYNKAVIASVDRYEWTTVDAYNKAQTEDKSKIKEAKEIPNIVKLTSGDEGQFEIKGLAYGTYKLEEIKAPNGYAVPTNGGNFTFTVANGSYTKDDSESSINYVAKSDKKDAMQIKNNTVTIPQTGGIGTVIFTAIGLAIMASAIIAIKKRQATEAR